MCLRPTSCSGYSYWYECVSVELVRRVILVDLLRMLIFQLLVLCRLVRCVRRRLCSVLKRYTEYEVIMKRVAIALQAVVAGLSYSASASDS